MRLLIGFLTGIAASMGLGGGFILILYLTLFAGVGQLEAQGVNLLFFLPIALFSVILHTRSGLVEWKKLSFAAAAGVIGAALGTVFGGFLGEGLLRKLFGGLLIFVALRELFHRKPAGGENSGAEQSCPKKT